MVEFEVVKDSIEYVPPSAEVLKRYHERILEGHDYVCYPESKQIFHPVTETMSNMVNEGWQVHTFSVDSKGTHYALMEREVPDAD